MIGVPLAGKTYVNASLHSGLIGVLLSGRPHGNVSLNVGHQDRLAKTSMLFQKLSIDHSFKPASRVAFSVYRGYEMIGVLLAGKTPVNASLHSGLPGWGALAGRTHGNVSLHVGYQDRLAKTSMLFQKLTIDN